MSILDRAVESPEIRFDRTYIVRENVELIWRTDRSTFSLSKNERIKIKKSPPGSERDTFLIVNEGSEDEYTCDFNRDQEFLHELIAAIKEGKIEPDPRVNPNGKPRFERAKVIADEDEDANPQFREDDTQERVRRLTLDAVGVVMQESFRIAVEKLSSQADHA